MMAGVILVVMGLTGTGTAVKYIPRPVIIGFTNGIALVIASTQLKDFLGLDDRRARRVHRPHRGDRRHISVRSSRDSVVLGGGTLVLLIALEPLRQRVPAYIVALFAGTARGDALGLDVETIGSRFGGIPAGLPRFTCRRSRPELILTLISPALTVAMLGAIESLLSAVVADRMGGDRHNPNTELFAQGVANIVSPLFGGLPATGAIARTATNIRSGARSPVVGHDPRAHAARRAAVRRQARRATCRCRSSPPSCSSSPTTWASGARSARSASRPTPTSLVWLVDLRADGAGRPDGGGRSRHGAGGADVHPPRRRARPPCRGSRAEYIEAGRPHVLQDKVIPDYVAIFRIHGPFLFGIDRQAA